MLSTTYLRPLNSKLQVSMGGYPEVRAQRLSGKGFSELGRTNCEVPALLR